MEDDKLKNLFAAFQPELSPDNEFMEKLERNLATVEVVREQIALGRKKNRVAVMVAAIAGFIFGAVSVLAYPTLLNMVHTILIGVSSSDYQFSIYENICTYILIAVALVVIAYSAYDITMLAVERKLLQQKSNLEPVCQK